MSPPKTHDISRMGWHMQDLECLANNIEIVSAFYHKTTMLRYIRLLVAPSRILVVLDIAQ